MSRPLRVSLQLLLLALVFAFGWVAHARLFGAADEEGDEESASVAPADMAVPVRTTSVRAGSLPRTLPFVGVVRASPGAEWVLSSRCGGRIVALHGAPGQTVHAGDALLEFERAPLEAARAQAESEVRAAELALETSGAEKERKSLELDAAVHRAEEDSKLSAARSERLAGLAADGLAAPKALEEAKNGAAQSQRELELARQARESWSSKGAELEHAARVSALAARRAALHEAAALLEAALLTAPADGQLVRLDVRPGDKLEPGAAAGVLLLREGRVLVCGIAPDELALVKPGMAAEWEEPHSGVHKGHVVVAIGALDPATGAAEVRIAPDPPSAPAPGLALRGEIVLEDLEGALLVPETALVRTQDKSSLVRVGSDGRAQRILVEVLARHAGLAAVKGELAAGDTVVLEGAYNLPEGARTVPLAEEPAAPPGEDK